MIRVRRRSCRRRGRLAAGAVARDRGLRVQALVLRVTRYQFDQLEAGFGVPAQAEVCVDPPLHSHEPAPLQPCDPYLQARADAHIGQHRSLPQDELRAQQGGGLLVLAGPEAH